MSPDLPPDPVLDDVDGDRHGVPGEIQFVLVGAALALVLSISGIPGAGPPPTVNDGSANLRRDWAERWSAHVRAVRELDAENARRTRDVAPTAGPSTAASGPTATEGDGAR